MIAPTVSPDQAQDVYDALVNPIRLTASTIAAMERLRYFSRTKLLISLDANCHSLARAAREIENNAEHAAVCECKQPLCDEDTCITCGRRVLPSMTQ
jgi:hypothetical protein